MASPTLLRASLGDRYRGVLSLCKGDFDVSMVSGLARALIATFPHAWLPFVTAPRFDRLQRRLTAHLVRRPDSEQRVSERDAADDVSLAQPREQVDSENHLELAERQPVAFLG